MRRKTIRKRAETQRKRRQLRSRLIWGSIGAIALGIFGVLVWNLIRPAAGEAIAIMEASSEHVAREALPQYHTDPPTSGPHLGSSLDAGFYQENDLDSLPPRPEGHLVHNLEHGYVIFWYNCGALDTAECDTLQSQIRSVMDTFNNVKLIAFPWVTIQEPVVMTSWGRMQRFEAFDPDLAGQFIRANRNRAPEPNAP